MKGKIGYQIMSFKDETEKDGVYNVFKKLKEVGISYVELSQIDMGEESVSEIVRACEDFDMKIMAISGTLQVNNPYSESLITQYDKIVSDAKRVGAEYIRLGSYPADYTGSKEKILEFCELASDYAKRIEAEGMKLYFHNHHREFVMYDKQYMMDIIKDNCAELGFEIDVFWVQRGGENPIEFIKGYNGRLDLLHLKDYKIIDSNTEVIDEVYKAKYPSAYDDVVRFAEIGEGSLDMKSIMETAQGLGTKYYIIEQDFTYGRDKYECVRLSVKNLHDLGYGDMFI